MPDLIGTAEAAAILGFDEQRSVSRLCRQGRFETAYKIGKTWLISRAEVLAYAERTAGLAKTDPRRGQK